MSINMHVLKRTGKMEKVNFEKIHNRLQILGEECNQNLSINYHELSVKLINQLYDGIPTSKLDDLGAEQCASLITTHYDYGTLAGLLYCSNLHKNTNETYLDVINVLFNNKDCHGINSPLVNSEIYNIVSKHHEEIQSMIDYDRDKLFDYFGFKTLERSYLFKINGKIIERPQHVWMRVSLAIHGDNMIKVKETYDALSLLYFTHATPTLFNAGTNNQQLSSCYLIGMEDDSISGIYSTLTDCAKISKWAGGIGLHIHNIRASGSKIRGTNGISNGILPMLRVFNNTAKYVDQGGGKRNGSIAIYLSPEHPDIENFLEAKKNHGDEEMRARDLFYALWIPDLFMKRVQNNEKWTLMCPDECPGLNDVYGDKYEKLYEDYEKNNKGRKTMNARDLWFKILESQIETGTPYVLYKDHANRKSNQKNLGTIKSSNLCTEIIEYSDENETAVCNLASIAINKFVCEKTKTYDFQGLGKIVKIVTKNLNKIIDINFYPTEKTRRSNLLHRPIGIGVQGLADVFLKMDLAFESDEAKALNKDIFETIYYYSMLSSYEIAKNRSRLMKILYGKYIIEKEWKFKNDLPQCNEYILLKKSDNLIKMLNEAKPIYSEIHNLTQSYLGSYSSYIGSPLYDGLFQFDMWGVDPSDRYNWNNLRNKINLIGVRNSLLVAPMPTASTAQILGNNECIEPYTSNIYARRTNAGDYVIVNKYLLKDLISINMWNEDIKNNIIKNNGSVQHLNISQHMKNKYKTAWEIKMKNIIDMSRDRGAYICQSQSLNLWIEEPTFNILTSMHFYSWKSGLKTGMYYLRTRPRAKPQQFTIEPENTNNCEMCSS